MQELVVMVGLQGCGKTTWVAQHLAATHVVVSKDHAARTGRARVPDEGLLRTRRRLQPPTLDEGFDRVDVVRSD